MIFYKFSSLLVLNQNFLSFPLIIGLHRPQKSFCLEIWDQNQEKINIRQNHGILELKGT